MVGKKLDKESGLRVRVDEQLKAEFIDACRNNDLTAAQVIRKYMKDYVTKSSKKRMKGNSE